ncbi:hypothetical protein Tco_0106124, partial [Tanacetum coccineum]
LCVVPVYLPEVLPKNLSEKPSGDPFGYLRRHVPPVSCDQLLGTSEVFVLMFMVVSRVARCPFYTVEILPHQHWPFLRILLPSGAFRPSIVYSFDLPFFLYHMSSGSQTVGDAIVLKFDMHVHTSVLTSDEVKNLVAEYAIPLDLHPCVPPSGLTMNRLSVDKIGIYDQYLELSGVRVPFSTFILGVIKHFRIYIS